jgi:uncharacterized protein (DUF58 family)
MSGTPAKSSLSPLLDPEAIQKTEYLGLQARTIVEGYMAGAHKSPFRGFAIEFTQHREYVPGDDIRHLDWKVLGRTDRYYVRRHQQLTDLHAHILLDSTASMDFAGLDARGRGLRGGAALTKFHYGATLAAAIAFLASERASYINGATLSVDGGMLRGLF